MPMSCALLGFYMIIKAVPQFVSSIMTGSVSGLDGGAVRGAAMAGYALGSTVISTSRMMAQKMIGGASVVSQAAQTYQYTSQAARDTGSTVGQARVAGRKRGGFYRDERLESRRLANGGGAHLLGSEDGLSVCGRQKRERCEHDVGSVRQRGCQCCRNRRRNDSRFFKLQPIGRQRERGAGYV
jgi:hypothetical protein